MRSMTGGSVSISSGELQRATNRGVTMSFPYSSWVVASQGVECINDSKSESAPLSQPGMWSTHAVSSSWWRTSPENSGSG